MSFSAFSSAWLFLLLVPLIVFYFLKLKRPRVEISSLALWRQVLSDQRVNSPFQKFKRNILLLLQILLLCVLVLAAMQPFLRRESGRANRLPILIDVSASMAALNAEGGVSRLAVAKKEIRALIDGMVSSQQICLVAFGQNARRLTPFTDNQRDLRAALETLEVEDVAGDLEQALRTAQALGRSAFFERVLLFSDGNFPPQTNFELPFQVDYRRIAPAGPNFGITAFNARRTPDGKWEAFVQLAGSAKAQSAIGTLELTQDGAVVATERVPLTQGSTPRLAFTLANTQTSLLHAQLKMSGFDALAADDEAWLELPAARPLAIYLEPKLASFRHALEAMSDVKIYPRDDEKLPAAFDLVVSGNPADLEQPARVHCGIGLIPPELQKLVAIEEKNSAAIDWRRDAQLLQHVSLNDVIFMEQPQNLTGVEDSSYANLDYEILARGPSGPLIVAKRDGDNASIYLLFQPDRSTLPYRVGFPILIANLVQIAMQQAGLAEAAAVRTGVLPPVRLAPDQPYKISGPRGIVREERSDARGILGGVAAPVTGRYVISGSGADVFPMGASLLSSAETSLAAVDQIQFKDRLTVNAATTVAKSDRSLWWMLAAAGFVVLLVEWWWFQRRDLEPAPASPARR